MSSLHEMTGNVADLWRKMLIFFDGREVYECIPVLLMSSFAVAIPVSEMSCNLWAEMSSFHRKLHVFFSVWSHLKVTKPGTLFGVFQVLFCVALRMRIPGEVFRTVRRAMGSGSDVWKMYVVHSQGGK